MKKCHSGNRASGDGLWLQTDKDGESLEVRKRKLNSKEVDNHNGTKLDNDFRDSPRIPDPPKPTTHETKKSRFDKEDPSQAYRRRARHERNRSAARKFYEELTESSILDNVGMISEMSLPFRNSTILLFVFLALTFVLSVTVAFLWILMWEYFPHPQILEVSMCLHVLARLFEKWILEPFKLQMYTPLCCANGTHDHLFTKTTQPKSEKDRSSNPEFQDFKNKS